MFDMSMSQRMLALFISLELNYMLVLSILNSEFVIALSYMIDSQQQTINKGEYHERS